VYTRSPMLSILVVNWNTRELLRSLLRSLKRFPPRSEYEIIVVDNASADRSAEMVRGEFPEVELIASEKNLGYAAGNNAAFAAANGEFLLTLNPDTEFRDSSLEVALDVLKSHPEHGALGIRQLGLDGSVQRSVRGFPTLFEVGKDLLGIPNRYRLNDFDYGREQDAPQPMGTFLMFRREALEDVGDAKRPFDESFPIFFNEVDLLFRLKEKGWKTLYSPAATVVHHGGESTKQVRKNMIWESHNSLVRFLKKHRMRWWNAPVFGVAFLLIYIGAFVRARGYSVGFRG
jgi:GT2 family glycosyltransferase